MRTIGNRVDSGHVPERQKERIWFRGVLDAEACASEQAGSSLDEGDDRGRVGRSVLCLVGVWTAGSAAGTSTTAAVRRRECQRERVKRP